MKTQDVVLGSVYSCKVNGRVQLVRVDSPAFERFSGGVASSQRLRLQTSYNCTALESGRKVVKTPRGLSPVATPEQDMAALVAYTDPLGAEIARLQASIEAKVPVAEARLDSELQAIGREWAREQTYDEAMARS